MNTLSIKLHVFSGRPDPEWKIEDTHPSHKYVLEKLGNTVPTLTDLSGLGYRGFSVEQEKHGIRQKWVIPKASLPDLERLLLSTKPAEAVVIDELSEHVLSFLMPVPQRPREKVALAPPPYEPEKWNIPTVQPYNNCYNYCNNMITNTFAQPGRAHGEIITTVDGETIQRYATKDGLVPLGMNKEKTGYNKVALVIWKNQDFHWYRLDNTGYWSHKPGKTAVTDKDNAGNKIANPRTCDLGPYTFYSFMGTNENVVIN